MSFFFLLNFEVFRFLYNLLTELLTFGALLNSRSLDCFKKLIVKACFVLLPVILPIVLSVMKFNLEKITYEKHFYFNENKR